MNMKREYPSPAETMAGNRAVIRPGQFLILPPENRCSSPHPNLKDTDEEVFVTHKLGAGYVMSELSIHPGGGTIQPFNSRLEHFLFILDGKLQLQVDGSPRELVEGSYAWLPPRRAFEIHAAGNEDCKLVWFRRDYQPLGGVAVPEPVFGNEKDVPAIPEVDINPEKQLIPYTNPGIDMAFNLIVVRPGGYYGLVETHAWEHAMFMLEGEGILVLNGEYRHVREGDFIHIAPYCPEWFSALGMEEAPVRFLLYWDCNRDYGDAEDYANL